MDTSTAGSFDEWEAVMTNAYVPVAIEPLGQTGPFRGELTHDTFDGVEFSTLYSSGQRVRRTPRLIARSNIEVLYVGICVSGSGRVRQDGRLAELRRGDMVFVDSRRPNWWESDGLHEQIVVQVPVSILADRGGWTQPLTPSAITVKADSAAAVVTDFLRNIASLQAGHPAQAAELAAHSVPLLASALALTAGQLPGELGMHALSRRRVLAFMQQRCIDPTLTVDDIARACLLSRRALYRLFDGSDVGVMARLWSFRVERAKTLLLADPQRPGATIAGLAGFANERQFYRVFRTTTGVTPGEFRGRVR
ncbi:helix-turn-helix domain-containing protein [Nocardia sp. NPDC058666]|uniref:AraC-like ligand-binding domain-containing protein n=1 Tax=unclassified Nocardia TaxID=2637762 RepID=UPI00364A4132